MPRYAPVMSSEDLQQMLIDRALKNNYVEDYRDHDPANPDMTGIIDMLFAEDLLNDVFKDWNKIDFSTENLEVTGEKTTPDGIPYIEVYTGGDWESPLVAILYFDGKKFRGYVPKDGNTYNHRAKAAFGNSDDDDEQAKKQFPHVSGVVEISRNVEPDYDLIAKDIAERLTAKGSYSYCPDKIVSKAKIEAEKQAKIEKNQDLTGPITPDMVYAEISPAAGCSYVQFKLRSSKRYLKIDEANRLEGIPSELSKHVFDDSVAWYAPMGCYPNGMLKILEDAGFVKDPKNDISMYQGARTIYIR